jgi:hypothetical protein
MLFSKSKQDREIYLVRTPRMNGGFNYVHASDPIAGTYKVGSDLGAYPYDDMRPALWMANRVGGEVVAYKLDRVVDKTEVADDEDTE